MTTLTDTQVITASGGLVELGYSQITSEVQIDNATAGTGKEVIAPLTVVCDGGPVLVEFFSPNVHPSNTNGDQITVSLFVDGAESSRNWSVTTNPGTDFPRQPMYLSRRITPTAGSHTFSVKAYVTNASRVGYVSAGSTSTSYTPAFLRVSKIVQATQWPAVTTGTIICTSSTRPASPFEGQRIYETDTNKEWVYDGTAWRVGPVVTYATYRVTNANMGGSATTWTNLNTATDLTITGASGDLVEMAVSGFWENTSPEKYLDVVTVVSGSAVNSIGHNVAVGSRTNAYQGIPAWKGPASAWSNSGGSFFYTLQSGDISSGSVTLRLQYRLSSATATTFYAQPEYPFVWFARNHGQAP